MIAISSSTSQPRIGPVAKRRSVVRKLDMGVNAPSSAVVAWTFRRVRRLFGLLCAEALDQRHGRSGSAQLPFVDEVDEHVARLRL